MSDDHEALIADLRVRAADSTLIENNAHKRALAAIESLRVERDTALRTMQAQQKGMVKQGDAVRELQALVTQLRDAAQEALDIEGDTLALNRVLVEENTRYKDALIEHRAVMHELWPKALGNVSFALARRYDACDKSALELLAALAPVPEED